MLKVGPDGRAGNEEPAEGAVEVDLAGAEVLRVGHSMRKSRERNDGEIERRERMLS